MDNLERTLGKILATQEHIVDRIDCFVTRLDEHIKDDRAMERRLDAIEHRMSYATGWIMAVVAGFSLLSGFFLKKIGLA